jgi:hypothetical protein
MGVYPVLIEGYMYRGNPVIQGLGTDSLQIKTGMCDKRSDKGHTYQMQGVWGGVTRCTYQIQV